MSAKRSAATQARTPESVEALLGSLDHPHKPEILTLRRIILEADPSIVEGVKWNSPSFHTSEYFATIRLNAKEGVQVVLHLGAKIRDTAVTGITIDDPESLLVWPAKDRATATFHNLQEVEAKAPAFAGIIRQWITYV